MTRTTRTIFGALLGITAAIGLTLGVSTAQAAANFEGKSYIAIDTGQISPTTQNAVDIGQKAPATTEKIKFARIDQIASPTVQDDLYVDKRADLIAITPTTTSAADPGGSDHNFVQMMINSLDDAGGPAHFMVTSATKGDDYAADQTQHSQYDTDPLLL